jgi:zinc transport system ATP-binding protein
MQNVSVRYGAFRALDDVTVAIPEGAFVAVIGPNGAGKTTLLNTIVGISTPDDGRVQVFGEAPNLLPPKDLGYVPQLKTLDRSFPAQALELVVTGLRNRWPWRITAQERELAIASMKRTGVDHLAQRPIARLSGGELQRVYLARSLVRQPRLLVLDEPAAGMDVAGEAAMYHMLMEYQQEEGATVVMITHDWEGARYHASHVLLLNRALAAFGPPKEVAGDEQLLQVFGHIGHVKATHGKDGDYA